MPLGFDGKMFSASWGFLKSAGFMAFLAIVGFGLAIYTGFFNDKQGNVTIEIMQPTKVLDIHQAVGGLSVSYDGEELRTAKKNLWLVSATFKNDGNAVIKKSDFDESSLLTLNVLAGSIVEKPTVITDNKYLLEHLSPYIKDNHMVFRPVIMEPNDKFIVSFFVLGSENTSPFISAEGKIAGVKGINVQKMIVSEDDKSFFINVFATNSWWYQIPRLFFYGLLFIISMALIAVCLTVPGDIMQARRKKKEKSLRRTQVSEYKPDEAISIERKLLLDLYVDDGIDELLDAESCLLLCEKRKSLYLTLTSNLQPNSGVDVAQIVESAVTLHKGLTPLYEKMKNKGLIAVDYTISESTKGEILEICDFLSIDLKTYRKNRSIQKRLERMELGHRAEILMREMESESKE